MIKITYLGHASFKVEADGKTIFLDPWLNGPTSPMKTGDVDAADIVLVTHDHGDHGYAEGVEICKKTGATFVAINELALRANSDGVESVHTLNIGGSIQIGDVNITLVHAFHSCEAGSPTGFIVKLPSGTLYHPGDTGIFTDMALFSELYSIDIFFVPIGSYYTMDITQAAKAVELIMPKIAIPMHYDTFPAISADPKEFASLVGSKTPKVSVEIFKPGDTKEINI